MFGCCDLPGFAQRSRIVVKDNGIFWCDLCSALQIVQRLSGLAIGEEAIAQIIQATKVFRIQLERFAKQGNGIAALIQFRKHIAEQNIGVCIL